MYWNLHAVQVQEVLCKLASAFSRMHNKPLRRVLLPYLLSHLAKMPDERLPKRVLIGHMDASGVRGKSQKQ